MLLNIRPYIVTLISLVYLATVLATPVHAQSAMTPVTLPPAPTSPLPPIPLPTPLTIPPPTTPTASTVPALLLTTLPQIPIDVPSDSIGIAQQAAHAHGYQARIIWIDGTANIASINTAEKIKALVDQIKQAGFNIIVFDVKPIVGYTLYPSRFAQKLTDWKGNPLPVAYDPLNFMVQYAHEDGLQIVANMSTFGEGHKYFNLGPAYTTPSWQTIMYEASRNVKAPGDTGPGLAIATTNALPKDPTQLGLFTDMSGLRNTVDGEFVDVVNFDGRVIAQVDGSALGTVQVNSPDLGAVLAGSGPAADYLRQRTNVGDILTYTSIPSYVPITQVPDQKITVFVNPNDPTVQQHELDIVREIVTNYPVDGMIFDDRMRYAALNADFSALTQKQFEAYVGHPIKWPDDIFQISPYPNQDIIKGPEYNAWLVFRALTIRNWLAEAKAVIKSVRPQATVSVYVGSWYGDYAGNGSNWAADDFAGPFPFLTTAYQKTGYAGLLDWITTGCYYTDATMEAGGDSPGATVEGAGILSNRAVNDATWVYAGLYADQFDNDPDNLKRCIQAAVASTQGVMVFDLSQIIQYNLWSVFQQAFASPATPPSAVPGLIDQVRQEHAAQVLSGNVPPPLGQYIGTSGTGL
jgi:uncharacterized lipoprotein YddW (UPF0748 family)